MGPRLERDDDRAREDDEREQEVRHHEQRVQVEDHRDPAEGYLGDRAERRHERDGAHEGGQAADAAGREPGRDREHDADERDQAVAELDRRMPALLGVRPVAATRPVVAAEAGRGQADDGSARDHDPEREHGHDGELLEAPRRDLEGASPGEHAGPRLPCAPEGGLLRLHCYR